MLTSKRKVAIWAAIALMASTGLTGCASMNAKTKGAIIGAVVGGAAGAIIGHQMDQQARELEQNIPGARVERVGEGIQVTFDSDLLFAFDSDKIQSAARSNLDALAGSLIKYPKSDLLIVGHTGATGTDEYNRRLSERRATSAGRYLLSKGVGRDIRTLGLGETEPVGSNHTDDGQRLNRRVEIAIYASKDLKDAALREAGGS